VTLAGGQFVDRSASRFFHCIARFVRRANLPCDGLVDRKRWLEDRLRVLSGVFSIAVAGFIVMANHLDVLLRLDPELAAARARSRRS
jgi:hypothetical protein